MLVDKLTQFYKDLSELDPNKPVLVTYSKNEHLLIYRQLNKIIMTDYISGLYFSKRGFTIGVLNQIGLNKLKQALIEVTTSKEFLEGELIPHIEVLGVSWYKNLKSRFLSGPQKLVEFKFVNITNKLLVWYICNYYTPEFKTVYKLHKNELKNYERSKNLQSQQTASNTRES